MLRLHPRPKEAHLQPSAPGASIFTKLPAEQDVQPGVSPSSPEAPPAPKCLSPPLSDVGYRVHSTSPPPAADTSQSASIPLETWPHRRGLFSRGRVSHSISAEEPRPGRPARWGSPSYPRTAGRLTLTVGCASLRFPLRAQPILRPPNRAGAEITPAVHLSSHGQQTTCPTAKAARASLG